MPRTHWLSAVSLALGLLGCTQSEEPPKESELPAPRAAAVALEEEPEPTFEVLPSVKEQMARLQENLKDPVDTPEEETALAEVQQELGGFQYVPSPEVVPAEPLEPLRGSFAADSRMVEKQIERFFGGAVVVSCGLPPCILSADFDGDGRRDQVVQVAQKDKEADKITVLFLLANEKYALLDPWESSGKGVDLLWALKWSVVPPNAEQPLPTLRLEGVADSLAFVGLLDGVKPVLTWIRQPGPPAQ